MFYCYGSLERDIVVVFVLLFFMWGILYYYRSCLEIGIGC